MSTTPVVDRIRIIPRADDFLDRNVGSSGEVFFNRATNSLRVFSGRDRGGFEIAKTDLSNILNSVFAAKATAAGVGGGSSGSGASISVSATVPATPANGNLWLNTNNGFLYVYVNDGNSSQWIQPAVSPPSIPTLSTVALTGSYSDLSNTPTIPGIATTQVAGTVKPGVGLSISQDGTLSVTGELELTLISGLGFAVGVTITEFSNDPVLSDNSASAVPTEAAVRSYIDRRLGLTHNGDVVPLVDKIGPTYLTADTLNDVTLTGFTTIQQTSEVLNTKTGATGVVVHDYETGAIFYHTSIAANFTANFTNVPTTNNRTTSVVLILVQGATPRLPTAVAINGATQTIEWQGGTIPTGTASQIDLVSFTLIRTASTWTVLGSLTTYA
jgi:hypothetical protein